MPTPDQLLKRLSKKSKRGIRGPHSRHDGPSSVAQLKTRNKVRRFTAVRRRVARKQERTDYQVPISFGACLCAVLGWSGGRQFPSAARVHHGRSTPTCRHSGGQPRRG
jgi:hypothetical protein